MAQTIPAVARRHGGEIDHIIGDTVNLAARLQTQAPVGEVAIGPQTARQLESARMEPLGLLHVTGREAPVAAQALLAV